MEYVFLITQIFILWVFFCAMEPRAMCPIEAGRGAGWGNAKKNIWKRERITNARGEWEVQRVAMWILKWKQLWFIKNSFHTLVLLWIAGLSVCLAPAGVVWSGLTTSRSTGAVRFYWYVEYEGERRRKSWWEKISQRRPTSMRRRKSAAAHWITNILCRWKINRDIMVK